MPGDPSSTLGNRVGLIAVELAFVAAAWQFLGLQHVIAAGLAVVIVASGVLPDRWSALVGGVLMLAGAAAIYIVYPYPGDRRIAMFIGAVGLVFAVVGVSRLRRATPR